MQEITHLNTAQIVPDANQPRKCFDRERLLALGKNMLSLGQQVPIIVFPLPEPEKPDTYVNADGERRWLAAKLVGMEKLAAIVLPERPSLVKLRVLQWSLEAHKAALTAMERSNLLAAIRRETDWGVAELANQLDISQPQATKSLTLQSLHDSIQALIHAGKLDAEKGYLIAQERDQERQVALAKEWGHLTRERLRAKVKSTPRGPKVRRATFTLPSGMTFTVSAAEAALDDVIEGLLTLTRELKKGVRDHWDIVTAQRVLNAKSKGGSDEPHHPN